MPSAAIATSAKTGRECAELQFEFLTSDRRLLALREDWRTLAGAHGTALQFFQDWDWVSQWWRCFAPEGRHQLRVLVGSGADGPVLIWPWVIAQRHGLRVLEPIGGLLSCFDDALVRSGPASSTHLRQAWQHLLAEQRVDAIELRGVHQDANIAPLLAAVGGDAIATTGAPLIDLSTYPDFDAYLSGLSKKMRQNQRRTHRSLVGLGKLRGSGDDRALSFESALDECLAFKARWLEARGLSGKTLMTRAGREFLLAVGRRFSAGSAGPQTCVSSLWLDERPISLGIGWRLGGRHFEYLGGFDYQLEHFGPGRLRMEYGIRACIDAGITHYDMLTPATRFKSRWTRNAPTVTHYVVPCTLAGQLYRNVYLRRVRPQLRRVYQALPGGFRRHLGGSVPEV